MKRLHLVISISLAVLFCFAAMVWAQEASYYDNGENKIIRVCTGGIPGAYTVNLEVKNTDADGTNDTTYSADCSNGAKGSIPLQIATPTDSVDVSLAYDALNSTAYVFYTNGMPTLVKCTISQSSPAPTHSISGTVTSGGSALSGVTMTLSGGATVNTDTSGNYTFSNLPDGAYTVTPSKSGYTFSPVSQSVGVAGTDRTGIDFTATAVSGLPDLAITFLDVLGAGNNGVPFNANLTIKNNGTAPAGSFTVKIYFSGWGTLNKYAILLQTWNVAGLAAGQSLSHTFSDLVFTGAGIHTTYYIHCKVDANNQIVESNEKNNLAPPVEVFVYR